MPTAETINIHTSDFLRNGNPAAVLAAPAFVFATVFALEWNWIQYYFFIRGPDYLDVGWDSYFLSNGTLLLENPPAIKEWSGLASHLASHMAPLLVPYSLLMKLIGAEPSTAYSIYYAGSFAFGGAVATFIFGEFIEALAIGYRSILSFVSGLVYSFSGLTMMVGGYPHLEHSYVPLAILTLYLIIARRSAKAWGALVPCMLLREDYALHIFGFLATFAAWRILFNRQPWKQIQAVIPYIAACLAYFVMIFLIQRTFFLGGDLFVGVYSGNPAYAHLTAALIHDRLLFVWDYRFYLILYLLAAAIPAAVFARLDLLMGHFATFPWLVLQLTAFSPHPGNIDFYYAFPFLVVLFWPLIILISEQADAHRPKEERQGTGNRNRAAISLVAILLVLGVSGWQVALQDQFGVGYVTPIASNVKRDQLHMRDWILSAKTAHLNHIVGDWSVAAFVPEKFALNNTLEAESFLNTDDVLFVYLGKQPPFAALRSALDLGLNWQAELGGSKFWAMAASRESFERIVSENGLALGDVRIDERPMWLTYMLPGQGATRAADGRWQLAQNLTNAVSLYGPYVEIPPGRYVIEARLNTGISSDSCKKVPPNLTSDWAVTTDWGRRPIVSRQPMALAQTTAANGGSCPFTASLSFEIPPGPAISGIEFPIWFRGVSASLDYVQLRQTASYLDLQRTPQPGWLPFPAPPGQKTNGRSMWSDQPGAELVMYARANLSLHLLRHDWSGILTVLVDDAVRDQLNLYSPTRDERFFYTLQLPSDRESKVTLKVGDHRDERSHAGQVWLYSAMVNR